MNSEQKEKKYRQQEKVFERDSRRLKMYQVFAVLALLFFVLYNFKVCGKAIGQSLEVRQILINMDDIALSSWKYPNGGNMFTEDGQRVGSDTTPVIFVLVREDYFEEMSGDTFHLIPYPTVEAIYGYHVQNWKPYKVEFFDFEWNVLEEEPLYIRKRKLFKE